VDDQQWIHRIALAMLKGIGPVNARNLVAYCGGVDAIFTDRKLKNTLEKVPGIGPKLIASITDKGCLLKAEKELAYVHKHKLAMRFYLDRRLPTTPETCRGCAGPSILQRSTGRPMWSTWSP
jgi:DNA processing protein